MAALATAWNAGVAAYRDPGSFGQGASESQLSEAYSRAWGYYRNDSDAVYRDASSRGLYRHTRLIYNPVPVVVDFYVDNVFAAIPESLEGGPVLFTPLSDGTPDPLKMAVAQLEQWGNWLSTSPRVVRFGAVAGGVMVEIDDDLEREKVVDRVLWRSLIKEKQLDSTGNVKSYALEYKAWDADRKEFYTFRKEADGELFLFFRDTKPFDPPGRGEGDPERIERGVYANPYGFAPAIYIKHDDDGDDSGTPAVSDYTKVDEINSLASHQHDRTHKGIEGGKVVATSGEIHAVTGASGVSRRGESGGISRAGYDPRYDWMLLKMIDGGVSDLDSGFDPSKIDTQVDRLLKSFERDFPELQAAEVIQNKAQISGAALERLLAPAQKKLDRASANYHQQYIKLRQMQIAISGWRFNGGGWTRKDAQQAIFKDFNLDSYSKGLLDFGIKRSLLVRSTPLEDEELRAKRIENAKNADGILDEDSRLEILVADPKKRAEILTLLGRKGPEQDAGEAGQ